MLGVKRFVYMTGGVGDEKTVRGRWADRWGRRRMHGGEGEGVCVGNGLANKGARRKGLREV